MSNVPTNLIPTRISQLPEAPVADPAGYFPIVISGTTYKVQFSQIQGNIEVPASRRVNAGTGLTGGGSLSADITIAVASGGIGDTQLDTTGVSAGTYGSGANVPVITVNTKGRVTSVSTTPLVVSGYVPDSRQIVAGTGLSGGGNLSADRTLAINFSSATPQPLGSATAGTGVNAARDDHVHPAVDLSDATETTGALPMGRGGTGTSLSPVAGALVFSNGTNLDLTSVGTIGQVLRSTGTTAPVWSDLSAGTVRTVDMSTTVSGLSFSGSPITVSGTITLAGTVGIASGGTGATTAPNARTNLGLGTMAVQDANSVSISGGSINVSTLTSSSIISFGTISETVGGTQYLVASQYDVGTAPNQIPLNQYLGTMAFQDAAGVNIGLLSATTANIASGTVTNLASTSATITNLVATSFTLSNLSINSANITTLTSGSATLTNLTSTSGTVTTLASTSANITTLSGTTATFTSATVTNLALTSLTLGNLSVGSANITTLTGTTFGTTATTQLRGASAQITTLTATSANITTLTGTSLAITTVNATNVEATNIKAKDGTAAIAIADTTGVVTVSTPTVISVNSASNALRITQAGAGNALVVEDSTNPDSSPLVIDTSGNLIQGNTASITVPNYAGTASNPLLQSVGTASSGNGYVGYNLAMYNNSTAGAGIIAIKSRNGTVGSHTVVNSGDKLFAITGMGSDGSSYIRGADISYEVDGAPASGSMPGRLTFSTTASGSSTPTERVRIDNAGNVGIGVTSPTNKLQVAGSGTVTTSVATLDTSGTAVARFTATYTGGGGGTAGTVDLRAGDNYAYLVTTTNSPLLFGTNRTERARIDTSGNLLIGTTTNTNSSRLVASGTISEAVSGTQYLVASQFDVGTAPNQIPLNQYLGTMAFQDAAAISVGQIATTSGNLAFTGTAQRITGDFSNTTVPNRVTFQSSTTNGQTAVSALPNGTSTQSQFLAYGGSDASNTNFAQLINNGSEVSFRSGIFGAGSYLPMTFHTNGAEKARLTTTGNLLVGTTTDISGRSGVISDVSGNVRAIPRTGSAKTAVYTLSISDVGQFVELGSGGGIDVPNGVFSTGDVVSVFNNTNAARTISLTITTAYIGGTDTDKNSVSLATRGVATVLFISNSLCVVNGNVS